MAAITKEEKRRRAKDLATAASVDRLLVSLRSKGYTPEVTSGMFVWHFTHKLRLMSVAGEWKATTEALARFFWRGRVAIPSEQLWLVDFAGVLVRREGGLDSSQAANRAALSSCAQMAIYYILAKWTDADLPLPSYQINLALALVPNLPDEDLTEEAVDEFRKWQKSLSSATGEGRTRRLWAEFEVLWREKTEGI